MRHPNGFEFDPALKPPQGYLIVGIVVKRVFEAEGSVEGDVLIGSVMIPYRQFPPQLMILRPSVLRNVPVQCAMMSPDETIRP